MQLYRGRYMLKEIKKKERNRVGLLLLAVFLNFFFIQLACSLPHVMQGLEPLAHAHPELDDHGHSHSHDKATAKTASHHHDDESDAHNSCCSEQANTPFIKASQDSGWLSVVKGQHSTLSLLTYAFYSCFPQAALTAVSHAPPEDLPPKVPDIRIFLQSLILFDIR